MVPTTTSHQEPPNKPHPYGITKRIFTQFVRPLVWPFFIFGSFLFSEKWRHSTIVERHIYLLERDTDGLLHEAFADRRVM